MKLLPIGTMVKLKEIDDVIFMIAGYCAVNESQPERVWDYTIFPFPSGYMSPDSIIQIDADVIERVIAMGYQDEEQFIFNERLEEAYDELKASAGKKN